MNDNSIDKLRYDTQVLAHEKFMSSSYKDGWYKCECCESLVYYNKIRSHVKICMNLSLEEWYEKNTGYGPRSSCINCGCSIDPGFVSNKITSGIKHRCNSCARSVSWCEDRKHEYGSIMSEYKTDYWKSEEARLVQGDKLSKLFKTTRFKVLNNLSRFLKYELMTFYVRVLEDGNIKYGISSNIQDRSRNNIYECTLLPLVACFLEGSILSKFDHVSESCLDDGKTEVIKYEKLDDLIKYVDSYSLVDDELYVEMYH